MDMVRALLGALDPRVGDTNTERYAPLLVTIALVIIALGAAFGFVPGANINVSIALLTGAGAGGYVMRQAPTPFRGLPVPGPDDGIDIKTGAGIVDDALPLHRR